MIRIAVNGVHCRFGSVPALDGLTLDVAKGDFVGIVGPNGSGKSTLLRVMSRALRPTRGAVLLDGRDVFEQDAAGVARRVAVVGQDAHTEFGFTVLDVVLMGRLPHLGKFQRESSEDVAIARSALAATGIAHLEGRRITELSAGERQRAVIARAIAQQPEILLMDEPTNFLDISHQADVMDLVAGLNRERGVSIVVVLHDLNLAAQYCRSLILLCGGRILAGGTPESVLTPENVRTAYGSEVVVTRHPAHGRPHVIVLPKAAVDVRRAPGARVHVIGGGGMATRLLTLLSAGGYSISAGALNAGDADWETARMIGAEVVEVPPFSAVSQDDLERTVKLMMGVSAVVLADIPFGPGNLKNLEAADRALEAGIPLVVVDRDGISSRDYTGGQASEAFGRIVRAAGGGRNSRVTICRTDEEAVAAVGRVLGPGSEGCS